MTLTTTGGDLYITGTIDGDGIGRNLTLDAGTGTVTIDNGIGLLIALNNLSINGATITWSDLGTAGLPGSLGTTSVNATGAIHFTGTNYNNGIQNYTAGTNFNFDAGALTTITSINQAITFFTGTIELAPLTDLTINSNGGDITLTELHGAGLNLNLDAITGTVTVATIGQPAAGRLQSVTITAPTIVNPDPIYSITAPILQSPTITFIIADQVGSITYGSPVVIAADNLTFSAGSFIFNSTVNSDGGSRNFTINPGSGNSVTFTGPIGNIIPLTSLTIGTAQDVTMSNTIAVGSFTQTGGTGTTTFSGSFNTTAAGGIQISTNVLSIQGIVTTLNGGALVLNNSGPLTASLAAFSIDGSFQQTGVGAVSIGGNITTTDDLISFAGDVTLANSLTLNTVSSTGAPVTFLSTVSGGEDLTITAGAGAVTFTGAVGTTRLGDLAINSAGSVSAGNISAKSIFQGSGSGSYTGTLDTNTVNGIQLTGSSFTFSDAVTTTSTGPFSIANSGLFTLTPGKTYSIGGVFIQSGSGSNSIGGNLVVGGSISFATAIDLGGSTILNTSANGTNVTVSSTINGANDLTFNLGTLGNLTLSGPVGGSTRLGAFTITNGRNITTNSIRATSITQTNAQISSTFDSLNSTGAISLTGALISVAGDLISSAGSVTVVNSNTLTLAAGSNSLIEGTFTQSGGGSVLLSGTLATVNNDLSFTDGVTLNGTTSLSTGSGIGNITFSTTLDGNQTLNLTAGIGNIVFTGAVGSTTTLGALSISSAADITYSNFSGASISQTSTGTTVIGGTMSSIDASGISLGADTVNQSGTITTINSGPVVINVTSSFTKSANILAAGGFSQTGAGTVLLTGSIATANNLISFAGPVTLSGSTSLNTGGAGIGSITFSGSVTETQDLSLNAGSGNIIFGDAVGGAGSARLGTLTIVTAQNVLAEAITATAISQLAGSGTTTINGAMNTNGASGISLIGTSFALQAGVTTTGGGAFILQNLGSSTLSAVPFSIEGAFSQTGAGAITLSSAITAGGAISFIGPTTLLGTPSLSTAAVNEPISFVNTVEGNGALTLGSGSGAITFFEDVGGATRMGALAINSTGTFMGESIRASSIVQIAGATTYNGNLDTTGSISLTGTTIDLAGNLTASGGSIALINSGALTTASGKTLSSGGTFAQSGGGDVSLGSSITTSNQALLFADPITLTAPVTLSTGAGAGDIILTSAVNGNQPFTLTAGTGDITFSSNVGNLTRIGALLVNSCHDITTKSITSASIEVLGSSGTLTLIGNYNTNTLAGIHKTVTNVFRNGNITTTNGGSLIVTNSGILTGTITNTTSISGSYIQNGTGIVDLAGTITTINSPISFSSSILLIDDAVLDSGVGSGNITLAGTVNGAKNLTLSAGAGNITLSSVIGGSAAVGTFQVTGCTDLSSQAIRADSISLSSVIGTATMSGDLVTSGGSGVALSGASFDISGAITCSGAGGLTLTNGDICSFSSTEMISLGGSFLQNGTAPVYMGGSVITNNQPITFQFDLKLTGNLILNSGPGIGDITIGPELDGNYALTVMAGIGDFTCNSIVGDHEALTNLTISANDIILASIGTSLDPGVTGVANLTATDFIALNGFFYNANTQIYTAGADLDCQTGTRVTLISSGPITCEGGIDLNSGTDLYVQTNGGAFSYERLRGTNFENFVVNTSGGAVTLGTVGASLEINNVEITSGQITLFGAIEALTVTMISNGSILNNSSPVDIQSQNTATFNALGGDVGTLSSPILVHTSGQIFAGSTYLADFNGSSSDNTVHEIPSNPPCVIIFNGITIQDCGRPNPSATPSVISLIGFPTPGFNDSQFNLASDYYFLPYFYDERYFRRYPGWLMYYRVLHH